MKKSLSLQAVSLSKQLTFTALFAALCCVGTLLIVVPLPIGYFNTGDVFVLLAAWCLGPIYGSVAAAVGSALADVISGFTIYAPVTFFVKGADALVAYAICFLLKKCIKKESLDFLPRLLSAILGETLMVLGYFVYECSLYGLGGAVGSVVGNVLQGLCCTACAVAIFSALYPVKTVKKLFPLLSSAKDTEE